jgi:tetratricopeptide (TPR) repeat protein
MVAVLPPLDAYRRDLAKFGAPQFGDNDGDWLATASLLRRFTEAHPADRQALGASLVGRLAAASELTFVSAGLRYSREIEEAGALNLANAWLSLLERTVPTDRNVDLGRVQAARARVVRRLGDPASAREIYEQIEKLGESSAEPELTTRAWIGYGMIAVERGNFPEARRWYEAAALVADDTGCTEEACLAHSGMLYTCAKMGDAEGAIVAGWNAYRLLSDDDDGRGAEILTNLSQFLYECSQYSTALRGFGAVVRLTTQPRILLAALGGAALAAAALEDAAVVNAAAARIALLTKSAWSHPIALAWLDLSDAYAILGDSDRAASFREKALVLAQANSHFELSYRATEPAPRARSAIDPAPTLGTGAREVIGHIESLRSPADLTLVS